MENASKALLIAASVLIVILLIAFGVRIFNSTSGVAEPLEGTMQSTEVAMFNNKFLQYVGEKKKVNDAKSIVNLIIANNSTNNRKIAVTLDLKNASGSMTGSVWNTSDISSLNSIIVKLNSLNSNRQLSIYVSSGHSGTEWNPAYDANGYINAIYILVNNVTEIIS